MTNSMLDFEIVIPISRTNKNHKAEKPVELYKYLIEKLTDEEEVVLDQFGGSCNCAQAAIESNRFGVVFEMCAEYIKAAVERFGAVVAGTYETLEACGETVADTVQVKEQNTQLALTF